MATYLAPIERPRGLLMKVLYLVVRRRFGKVATPLTVFSARMPFAFTSFYGKVSRLDNRLRLARQTRVLIRERVASLNTCHFCMDAARYYVMQKSPGDLARLDALDEYRTSPLFTDAERAALEYATELTTEKAVSPETFERLRRHYGEREICDIAWLVASEHLYNISNIALNIGSDGLCELSRKRHPVATEPDDHGPRPRHRSAQSATGSARQAGASMPFDTHGMWKTTGRAAPVTPSRSADPRAARRTRPSPRSPGSGRDSPSRCRSGR
jgi:alkylhydroperoxidase family enzyme